MTLNLLALAIHVALGGAPWDGWTGVHGIPGTPNGVWRSTFGRLGAFSLKASALRPDPATDLPDPSPPPGFDQPRITDLKALMRDLWAFPGVQWAPALALKPFALPPEPHPCQNDVEVYDDPEAFRLSQLQAEANAHV